MLCLPQLLNKQASVIEYRMSRNFGEKNIWHFKHQQELARIKFDDMLCSRAPHLATYRILYLWHPAFACSSWWKEHYSNTRSPCRTRSHELIWLQWCAAKRGHSTHFLWVFTLLLAKKPGCYTLLISDEHNKIGTYSYVSVTFAKSYWRFLNLAIQIKFAKSPH